MVVRNECVLLVDDKPTNLNLLCDTLAEPGRSLLVAQGGARALEIAQKTVPALILLDLRMPDIDGFEVCARLKQNPRTADVPVIFLSAIDDVRDKVRAFDLGAVDYITKPFQTAEVQARVKAQLTIRHLQQDLQAANRRMIGDLSSARRVQNGLLPHRWSDPEGYRIAWRYRPCEELAGDSLNLFALDDRHVGFYVLDVSGHGVAAALLSVSVTHALASRAGASSLTIRDGSDGRTLTSPPEVLSRLNDAFPFNEDTGQFFTIVYGVLDTETGWVEYANAGHPFPIRVSGGTVEEQTSNGPILGLLEDVPYPLGRVRLSEGDRLVIYTDGLCEEEHGTREGDRFGTERVYDLFREGDPDLETCLQTIEQTVRDWRSPAPPKDDLSLLVIERQAEHTG